MISSRFLSKGFLQFLTLNIIKFLLKASIIMGQSQKFLDTFSKMLFIKPAALILILAFVTLLNEKHG
jgi:hypothetical protein